MGTHLMELNKSAYQYYLSILPEYNEICAPLYRLGINFFAFTKIFNDGSYIRMSSEPKLTEIYLSQINNQGEFFTNKLGANIVTSYSSDISYFNVIPYDISKFDKNKDPIIYLLNDFGLLQNYFFTYKTSQDNYIDAYAFSIKRDYINANQFYLNNASLIEHFIKYFLHRSQDIINIKDKTKLAHFEQTFNFHLSSEDIILEHNIMRFFEETQIKRMTLNSDNGEIKLTARETDCINYLSIGYSIKEIARKLDLSPRTVEAHINHIKQKTGYYSKSKMVNAFISANNSNTLNHCRKDPQIKPY